MKIISFIISFFFSLSLIGQCTDLVLESSNGLPSETPDNLECIEAANKIIAEYYSPNIYHMTDMASNRSVVGRADLLTSVFYDVDLENVTSDEDLSTGNNWTSLENYSSGETEDIDELDPYVYYSVVWTENYWVIAYGFYHPRDWAGGGACCGSFVNPTDSHENDYEAAMFVVDRNTYTLKGAVTIFHGPLLKYSTTLHDLTNNPNVFIDDRTHAVVMNLEPGECIDDQQLFNCDGCEEFYLDDPENHVFYRAKEESSDPYVRTTVGDDDKLYGEGRYILEDVFGSHEYSLSNQRDNPFVFVGESNGSFYAATDVNCINGTASAPWGFGNFKHTREDIERAICFAETGNFWCYPVGQFPPLVFGSATIEYNPYFPTQCGEETLSTASGESFTISNSFEWNYPENWVMGNNITIQNGATLSVNNRTLLFAPGTGIIVKEGGRLVANNATFDVCPQALGEAKWRGISAAYDQSQNIVELRNNTVIKNAEVGLLLGQGAGIVADGIAPIGTTLATSFIDNNIGIHSFSKGVATIMGDCQFIGNNTGVSLVRGIETLHVVSCIFEDNDIGISAFDSPLIVRSGNIFDGGRIGILTGATNPMASNVMIGRSTSGSQNIFRNLEKGVFAMGGGASFGLSILNNTFENIQENAVQIRGESSFLVGNNLFDSNKRGLEVMGSGSTINRIQCNQFTGNEVVDNVLASVNNNTQFLENDYSTDAQFKNIAWFATLPDMGSAALSASNCFNDDNGISPDIASLNSNNFAYFYKNDIECQEQEPNGLSNILKEQANENFNGCNGLIGPFNFIDPGNGNGGQVDINNFDADIVCELCILDSINYYKNQIVANGGINPYTGNTGVDAPTTDLVKQEQIFEQWVNFGLFVASEKKDFGFTEAILAPLYAWKWKIRQYGLSLQKADFSEAANRLAALPNTNSNQVAFKSTQEINLKYLTAKALGTENQITQEDLETLRDIGLSYDPSNGYARTLLYVLTGAELPTLIPELEEYIETAAKAGEKEESSISILSTDKAVTIFPNPAKDYIQIKSLSKPIVRIILTDFYGKSVIRKEGNDYSTRIETTEMNTGIYLIQLQLEDGELITQKMIIDK